MRCVLERLADYYNSVHALRLIILGTDFVSGVLCNAQHALVHRVRYDEIHTPELGMTRDILEVIYAFGVKMSKVKVTGSISPFCILEPRFIDIRQVAMPVVCSFADA